MLPCRGDLVEQFCCFCRNFNAQPIPSMTSPVVRRFSATPSVSEDRGQGLLLDHFGGFLEAPGTTGRNKSGRNEVEVMASNLIAMAT